MLAGLKGLLGHHSVYVGLQKVVGADRLRYRCLDELALKPGETVLDLGCGPAYYLGRLPEGVRYFGFDTSTTYINHARKRWGDGPQFRAEIFTETHAEALPPINAVMLLGLLHHLSDDDCRQLLTLVGRVLAPGGRVISVDPCFEPTQGRISHWMSANDRGEYVRPTEEFTALGREFFKDVEGEVLNTTTRIPSSHWMMRMAAPVTTYGALPRGH